MAIFHMRVRGVAPSRGASPVATAAYQSGRELTNERTGELYRYQHAERVLESEIALPDHAPEWARDPQRLWNACQDAWAGGRSLAAHTEEMALPKELTPDERRELALAHARQWTERGYAVQWSLHDDMRGTGNYHVHYLVSAQQLTPQGFERDTDAEAKTYKAYLCRDTQGNERMVAAADFKQARDEGFAKVYNYQVDGETLRYTKAQAKELGLTNADRKSREAVATTLTQGGKLAYTQEREQLKADRRAWADLANEYIAKHNERYQANVNLIDSRSHAERGLDTMPTRHIGYQVHSQRAQEVRQYNSVVQQINRAIDYSRQLIAKAVERTRAWWQKTVDPFMANRQRYIARDHDRALSMQARRELENTRTLTNELAGCVRRSFVRGEERPFDQLAAQAAKVGIEIHAKGNDLTYTYRGKTYTAQELGIPTSKLIEFGRSLNQLTPEQVREMSRKLTQEIKPKSLGTRTVTREVEIDLSRGIDL